MSIYRGRNRRDFTLASALYDSITDNDFRGVSVLLEKGADANIVLQKTGISPFHLVIGNDCEDFAVKTTKLILRYGGDPNVQSDDGLTPLHIAAAWGRANIVELLLGCGGDPEKRDINYTLPINYAVEYKHQNCTNILLKFMYTGVTKQATQENEDCQLILEKVILNNGIAEAEYEVDSGKESSLLELNSEHNLQQLPQTTPTEYVRHWCSAHAVKTQLSNSENSVEANKSEFETKQEEEETNLDFPNSSLETNILSPDKCPFVNCKPRNLNKKVTENFSLPYESSLKYKLRKTNSSGNKKGVDIPIVPSSFCKHTEGSRESGITTLPDTTRDSISITDFNVESIYNELNKSTKDNGVKQKFAKNLRDASSDYFTCNEISGSTNILEQNIFGLSSLSSETKSLYVTKCSSHGLSFGNEITDINGITNVPCNISEDPNQESVRDSSLKITEVYKYIDNQKGIVLYENRLLKPSKGMGTESNTSGIQSVQSSKLSSLPASFDYDTDTLKKELTLCGYNPGPITRTTKRIYLRKLHHLKKRSYVSIIPSETKQNIKVYSMELEKTLKNPNWIENLAEYKNYDDVICKEFNNPDPSRKWREGLNKSSFTYLLLDPRITDNLPARADLLSTTDVWQTFVSSIFYVGKGKRSRPYSHLYEAAALWKEKNISTSNKKLQHILNIWNDNFGVVCLHVFQNVIPVEAYTREASMINALKIENIKNIKSGDFYGIASTWSSHQQKMLGVLLLYRAMIIFLNEGERQLRPADIN